MKQLFFLYILYLALFTAISAYGACTANFCCIHDCTPGKAHQFFLLEDKNGGPFFEAAQGPRSLFPDIPFKRALTFIPCAQDGTITTCDTLNSLTLTCPIP